MAKRTSGKKVSVNTSSNYLEKLENDIQSNQSKVSMILGALIVLVLGILVFNYFNKNKPTLGPAQQTQQETQEEKKDVAQDKLPGSYTVKEGDTLFTIAEKYYQDGSRFTEIAKANNLNNPDEVEVGLTLQIPKLETQPAQASPAASLELASPQPEVQQTAPTVDTEETPWGPKIEGTTYTVLEDDWLSKIAGRAYGDIMAFEKIVKANNIANPDHIEPGWVLTIPR